MFIYQKNCEVYKAKNEEERTRGIKLTFNVSISQNSPFSTPLPYSEMRANTFKSEFASCNKIYILTNFFFLFPIYKVNSLFHENNTKIYRKIVGYERKFAEVGGKIINS